MDCHGRGRVVKSIIEGEFPTVLSMPFPCHLHCYCPCRFPAICAALDRKQRKTCHLLRSKVVGLTFSRGFDSFTLLTDTLSRADDHPDSTDRISALVASSGWGIKSSARPLPSLCGPLIVSVGRLLWYMYPRHIAPCTSGV